MAQSGSAGRSNQAAANFDEGETSKGCCMAGRKERKYSQDLQPISVKITWPSQFPLPQIPFLPTKEQPRLIRRAGF